MQGNAGAWQRPGASSSCLLGDLTQTNKSTPGKDAQYLQSGISVSSTAHLPRVDRLLLAKSVDDLLKLQGREAARERCELPGPEAPAPQRGSACSTCCAVALTGKDMAGAPCCVPVLAAYLGVGLYPEHHLQWEGGSRHRRLAGSCAQERLALH